MQGSSRTGASRPRGHMGTWRWGFTTGPSSPATALLRPLLRGLSARTARGFLGGLLPCRLPSRGLLSGRLLSGAPSSARLSLQASSWRPSSPPFSWRPSFGAFRAGLLAGADAFGSSVADGAEAGVGVGSGGRSMEGDPSTRSPTSPFPYNEGPPSITPFQRVRGVTRRWS